MPYNSHVLIGRDAEIAALQDFLTAGSALVVSGAPGVGKTALTRELRADGWRVVRATGVEAETAFTLGGLNQVLYPLRAVADGLDAPERDILAPVFGADPLRAPEPLPLAMAILDLFADAAAEQPLLVCVDDVHWFDELSAVVLGVIGRRLGDPRVRILATYRPHTGSEFATAGWDEIRLGELSDADSVRLVDTVTLSPAARRTILEVAAGNPLALTELPRNADQIGRLGAALPLTDRLVTVFGGKLARLDFRVRTELLRAALDGSGPQARYVMSDVAAAVVADLVVANALGNNVFRHPLVREAVIHQAGAQERRAAHAHLATLYDDVLIRRATHLSAAAVEPDQDLAELLAEAAALTIKRGGAATAVDWLQRAAKLCTVPRRRSELLADAGFVASQAGRYFDTGSPLDADQSVLNRAYLAMYRDGDVVTAHRQVLGELQRTDAADPTRLINLALVLAQYAGDAELWRQTESAIAGLGERVDELSLVYRDTWGDTARRGGNARARIARHADDAGEAEPWQVMRLGVAAYYVDGLAEFRDTLRHMFDREHERGAVTNAITMAHLILLDLMNTGQLEQAAEAGRIGLELTTTHRSDLFAVQFAAYLGVVAAMTGDLEEARRKAAEVNRWAGPRRIGMLLGWAGRILVLTALAEGDYQAAYDAACAIAEPGTLPPFSHAAIDTVLDLVESAIHAGRPEAARAHACAARDVGLSAVSPRQEAIVSAVLAMTAPDAEADDGYRAALAQPGLAEFPFDAARIRLAYGMWLRRQRHHTQARDELAAAAEIFETIGATAWSIRARTELRASGATVKRGDGVLTAQERRIAELAAAGHSNKQIGEQLYLSPRTVGAHLYRIFPKLGVTSRAALGAVLRESAE